MPLLLIAFFVAASVCVARCVPLQTVDMSYVYNNSTLGWPTMRRFQMELKENGTQEGGYWYQEENFITGTHVGTHMDAPCHFARGRWCMDEIPVGLFFGPAAVVDITSKAEEDRDVLVSVQDLQQWERGTGRSLDGTIVLIRTGWGRRWPDKKSYTGTNTDDPTQFHFPGVSREAAQWLVDNRKIHGLGTDCLSLDNGPSADFWAHRILLGNDVFGLENVANLEEIPVCGAMLSVLPMNIGKASGAPVRIIATFPRTGSA